MHAQTCRDIVKSCASESIYEHNAASDGRRTDEPSVDGASPRWYMAAKRVAALLFLAFVFIVWFV